ncbi:hypothetical protein BH11MYX4_BH11MYX4_67500 [soil metagenome]
MGSNTTDPGLGPATTSEDGAATDPMRELATTTDVSGPPTADGGPAVGENLLQGLRRDRPPPRLSPIIRPESEGGEAVAYYAGPQAAPERFETPPLVDAIEIATTPTPLTTEPIPREPVLAPVARGAGDPPGSARTRAHAATFVTRPRSRLGLPALIVGAALVVATAILVLYGRTADPLREGPQAVRSAGAPSAAPARSSEPGERTPSTSAIAPTPSVEEPPPALPATSVRIPATALAPRPTGHPAASAPSVREPRPVPTPAISAEPRSTPPAAVPSAKIDHVRSI